jgi:cell division protease FtsH
MTQQLNYADWQTRQTIQPKSRSRRLVGWVIFIALAVLLLLLLNKSDNQHLQIPLSDFESRLKADRVQHVTIEGDNLVGDFRNAETFPQVSSPVRQFRVILPSGAGQDWRFVQWVLDNRSGAVVDVANNPNLLIDILVPLIPWLLIFAFLWFFVSRQMKNIQAQRPPSPVYIVPPPSGTPPSPPITGAQA